MYKILPLSSNFSTSVDIPGSKYIANRVLPVASFASSPSVISNVPFNEDIETSIEGLTTLGANFSKQKNELHITPITNRSPLKALKNEIYCHDSGTFTRFITPLLTLSEDFIHLTASKQMSKRPMQDLFEALSDIGATIISAEGQLPAQIKGPLNTKRVQIDPSKSSQFVSSLMILAPLMKDGLTIELTKKPVSNSYILMTQEILKSFGIVSTYENQTLTIANQKTYKGQTLTIETDPVSSSYFFLLAAINQSTITINNYPQGDTQKESIFPFLLEKMGCKVEKKGNSITLTGVKELKPIEVDMENTPDIVPSLCVACMYAKGKSVIKNIAHLRYKESNRLDGCANNLQSMGIHTEVIGDDLHIDSTGSPHGTVINPNGDHRMAMSFAIAGSRTSNTIIEQPSCVNKSFPTFWETLKKVGVGCEEQ